MRKRTLIYVGCVLLLSMLAVLYLLLREEKPQYVMPDIPMPQYFATYTGEYAESEEFSTFVSNGSSHYRYFVYRMYVPVHLGEQGFETKNDVENYYDEWLKKLSWQEARSDLCNYFMREFLPEESYRAYVNPTLNHGQPRACLVTWSELGDEDHLTVLIKTINPSSNVDPD